MDDNDDTTRLLIKGVKSKNIGLYWLS